MIYPKKRLVYHLYLYDNWLESITNKIHMECLKYYSHIFDDVIFVISIDNVNNHEIIKECENILLDVINTPSVSFKVVENTYLRETKTFYDLIATQLDVYDGLTFFAHSKGVTNLKTYDIEQMITWITSMYFLSLEYIDEVINTLTDGREMSYGSLLNEIKDEELDVEEEHVEEKRAFIEKTKVFLGKNKYQYMGTFFWLNGRTIAEYLKKNDIELPKLSDRWYDENFCANIFPLDYAFSHKGRFTKNYLQEGADIIYMICHCLTNEELEVFFAFRHEIMKRIEQYD